MQVPLNSKLVLKCESWSELEELEWLSHSCDSSPSLSLSEQWQLHKGLKFRVFGDSRT